ncbi:MAG: DUF4315 family protein [Clostridia bacterium]|nr:DUF4315 family protein [Clostridia bacterium]
MGAKLDKIGLDLKRARAKRMEWDSKVKERERKYKEEENTEIHDMVHAANITPEQLAELIQRMNEAVPEPQIMSQTEKEEEAFNEE